MLALMIAAVIEPTPVQLLLVTKMSRAELKLIVQQKIRPKI